MDSQSQFHGVARLPGTQPAASPFWSPDSRYVAYSAENQIKKIDVGGGPPETLCTLSGRAEGSGTWNRDDVIVFGSWGGGSGGPLWKISQAGGTATPITEVDTSKGELYHTWPTFLPDGQHFLYFRSGTPDTEGETQTGRAEIFVRPFVPAGPNGVPALGEGKWQVSKDGGNWPWWRADGKELVYTNAPSGTSEFAVEVKAGGTVFESGVAQQLFQSPIGFSWDMSADGQRLLAAVPTVQRTGSITMVLDWPALVKRNYVMFSRLKRHE